MALARSARAINLRGKQGSVIYRTDQENEVSKIFIISLYLGIERAGREASSKLNLAGRTVEYDPQNWPITARALSREVIIIVIAYLAESRNQILYT